MSTKKGLDYPDHMESRLRRNLTKIKDKQVLTISYKRGKRLVFSTRINYRNSSRTHEWI